MSTRKSGISRSGEILQENKEEIVLTPVATFSLESTRENVKYLARLVGESRGADEYPWIITVKKKKNRYELHFEKRASDKKKPKTVTFDLLDVRKGDGPSLLRILAYKDLEKKKKGIHQWMKIFQFVNPLSSKSLFQNYKRYEACMNFSSQQQPNEQPEQGNRNQNLEVDSIISKWLDGIYVLEVPTKTSDENQDNIDNMTYRKLEDVSKKLYKFMKYYAGNNLGSGLFKSIWNELQISQRQLVDDFKNELNVDFSKGIDKLPLLDPNDKKSVKFQEIMNEIPMNKRLAIASALRQELIRFISFDELEAEFPLRRIVFVHEESSPSIVNQKRLSVLEKVIHTVSKSNSNEISRVISSHNDDDEYVAPKNLEYFDDVYQPARVHWDVEVCTSNLLCMLVYHFELEVLVPHLKKEFQKLEILKKYKKERGELRYWYKDVLESFNKEYMVKMEYLDFDIHIDYQNYKIQDENPDHRFIRARDVNELYREAFMISKKRRNHVRDHLLKIFSNKKCKKNQIQDIPVKLVLSTESEGIKERGGKLFSVGNFFGLLPLDFGISHAYVLLRNIAIHFGSESLVWLTDLEYGDEYSEICVVERDPCIFINSMNVLFELTRVAKFIVNVNENYVYSAFLGKVSVGTKKMNCQVFAGKLMDELKIEKKLHFESELFIKDFKILCENPKKKKDDLLKYMKFLYIPDKLKGLIKEKIGVFHGLSFEPTKEEGGGGGGFISRFFGSSSGLSSRSGKKNKVSSSGGNPRHIKHPIRKGYTRVYFKNHSDLDRLYQILKNKEPDFEGKYPGVFQMLKSLDRSYWIRYVKLTGKLLEVRRKIQIFKNVGVDQDVDDDLIEEMEEQCLLIDKENEPNKYNRICRGGVERIGCLFAPRETRSIDLNKFEEKIVNGELRYVGRKKEKEEEEEVEGED